MRIFFGLAAILLSFSASALTTYKFEEVRPMGSGRYMVTVGGSAQFYSKQELGPILRALGTTTPAGLVGKSFQSPLDQPSDAMDLLRFQGLNPGYVSPTPDQFNDRLAKELAAGTCSDPSKWADSHAVYEGMSSAYEGGASDMCPKLKKDFVQNLQKKISELNSKMRIAVAPSKELAGVQSPCSEYFFVMENGKPVTKFSYEKAANGFACTKDAAAIASASNVPASAGGKSSGGSPGGGTP